MRYCFYLKTSLHDLWLIQRDDYIESILFAAPVDESGRDFVYEETPVVQSACCQLQEYLEGKRKTFEIPLCLNGTSFQKSVWAEAAKVPYGQVLSYLDIARNIGNFRSVRAVGQALSINPLPILIPCHRIISSNGKLGGYSGGLELKIKLLTLEGVNI